MWVVKVEIVNGYQGIQRSSTPSRSNRKSLASNELRFGDSLNIRIGAAGDTRTNASAGSPAASTTKGRLSTYNSGRCCSVTLPIRILARLRLDAEYPKNLSTRSRTCCLWTSTLGLSRGTQKIFFGSPVLQSRGWAVHCHVGA